MKCTTVQLISTVFIQWSFILYGDKKFVLFQSEDGGHNYLSQSLYEKITNDLSAPSIASRVICSGKMSIRRI